MNMGFKDITKGIFKAYDIRGLYPEEVDREDVYRIARAFASVADCDTIVVGHDMRESADTFAPAVIEGILDQGVNVIDIGLTSTPMCYFAVIHTGAQGCVMCTASHNPAEYNGLKMTVNGTVPSIAKISNPDLREIAAKGEFADPAKRGTLTKGPDDLMDAYTEAVLDNCGVRDLAGLKVVVDCANGMGGYVLPTLFKKLGNDPAKLYWRLDGSFPNHEANPLKTETLLRLRDTVVDTGADIGVAYDGDADRVAFVDEKGQLISGDFVIALIAQPILKEHPGLKIMYDLRSSMVVPEVIEENGGTAVKCRVGHALIKKQMREEGGYFGGELSSHYYFGSFYTTDNGDLAMLNIIKLMLDQNKPLSEIVAPLRKYFHSGEINSKVESVPDVLARLKSIYAEKANNSFELDGFSAEFDDWWFNVRPSNTEPLIRLNLEAKEEKMMKEKVKEVLAVIRQ